MLSIIHKFEGELTDILVEINKYKLDHYKVNILKIVSNKQLMDIFYTFIIEIKGASSDQKDKILELYNTHYANS